MVKLLIFAGALCQLDKDDFLAMGSVSTGMVVRNHGSGQFRELPVMKVLTSSLFDHEREPSLPLTSQCCWGQCFVAHGACFSLATFILVCNYHRKRFLSFFVWVHRKSGIEPRILSFKLQGIRTYLSIWGPPPTFTTSIVWEGLQLTPLSGLQVGALGQPGFVNATDLYGDLC